MKSSKPNAASRTFKAATSVQCDGIHPRHFALLTVGGLRAVAMLLQAKIPTDTCDKLGNAEVDSAALFGSMGYSKDGSADAIHAYFKDALDIDPRFAEAYVARGAASPSDADDAALGRA